MAFRIAKWAGTTLVPCLNMIFGCVREAFLISPWARGIANLRVTAADWRLRRGRRPALDHDLTAPARATDGTRLDRNKNERKRRFSA